MNIKVVSFGGGANKIHAELISSGVVDTGDSLFVNSTLKDVPNEFKLKAVTLPSEKGGCGKSRQLAKEICMTAIQDGTLDCLDEIITDEDEMVVLIATCSGGTGSGSLNIIAKYYQAVVEIPVHIIAVTGFDEDSRSIMNTIEFFQELEEGPTVQIISNKKFLDDNGGNKLRAEKAANEYIAQNMRILTGKDIVESEQNIDETDLYKVATTPGYMMIGRIAIDNRIKNTDQLNKLIVETIDDTKALDVYDKAVKRLGVIVNISKRRNDMIDFNFEAIKSKTGQPFELFIHVQHVDEQEENISFIASGCNMPLDEVKDIYEKYKQETAKINVGKDKFFEFTDSIEKDKQGNKKAAFLNEVFTANEDLMLQPKKEVTEIAQDKKNFMESLGGNVVVGRRKRKSTFASSVTISDTPVSLTLEEDHTITKKMTREDYLNKY